MLLNGTMETETGQAQEAPEEEQMYWVNYKPFGNKYWFRLFDPDDSAATVAGRALLVVTKEKGDELIAFLSKMMPKTYWQLEEC